MSGPPETLVRGERPGEGPAGSSRLSGPDRASSWLTAAGALAATGLLRAAHGYRSFPSGDDFAYVPMALSRLDPHLFPRDVLLRETPLHMVLLKPLVALLQATTGLALGFWLVTILLSLLTLLGMYRWMRALGLPGALLPVAGILACSGWLQGLGRGEFDGVFGDAFHFQWAALCALVWAYDGLLRARWWTAASLLFFSLLCHPVVGAHGVIAAVCGLASAWASSSRARRWLLPASTGICATLGVVASFVVSSPNGEAISQLPALARSIYFRTHEYDIDRAKTVLLLFVVASGIAGIARLARKTLDGPTAALLGLLTGHMLILAGHCVLYDGGLVSRWSTWTALPFQLSLSRTTPLLLALSSVAAVAGLEKGFFYATREDRSLQGLTWLVPRAIQFAAAVCLAAIQVRWTAAAGACCGVAAASLITIRKQTAHQVVAAGYIFMLVGGLVLFAQTAPISARVSGDQDQLLQWARSQTSMDALFIVPPSFLEFRMFAKRSVYVDFKTVTPGDSRMVALWKVRLDEVAAPDRLACEARGWEGVPEWDRTYAGRNTPSRIESLLRETGADYFVWDRRGLQVPPFVHRDRPADPAVVIAFENARYHVYRLAR